MLEEYRQKRDFENTPEPSGKAVAGKAKAAPVFCVQHHLARRDHFDLRLEFGGVLVSWAVPKGIPVQVGERRLAVKVEDHPLGYLDFEGTIPKGQYGGGTVQLWDIGTFEAVEDMESGLKSGSLKVRLDGRRLRGKWAIVRTDNENWLVIKEREKSAQSLKSDFKTSVKTGRTMEEIADGEDLTKRKNPFSTAKVQLAEKSDFLPEGDKWVYEIKYDGYRVLAFAEGGKVRLVSRGGKDCTKKFIRAARSIEKLSLSRALVVDGEMTAEGKDGRPDFGALADLEHTHAHLKYFIFDILALDGMDLRDMPLRERREILSEILPLPIGVAALSETAPAKDGEAVMRAAQNMRLEGMIAKRFDSIYSGERSADWIKVKCRPRREFVIGGCLVSESGNSLSSLLLGVYGDDGLIYVGKVGSGFSEREREKLYETLSKIKITDPPFALPPKSERARTLWVKPKLVAEVEYAELTSDGKLRQASFKGLRDDKKPEDVYMDESKAKSIAAEERDKGQDVHTRGDEKRNKDGSGDFEVCGVRISSPDRIVYVKPRKIEKAELAEYYAAVSERMLPYLKDRAVSAVRCHDRADGERFFKKHVTTAIESSLKVTDKDGETSEHIAVDSLPSLITQVQLGTVEFHIRGSRAAKDEKPDMLVFDLDPDEGLPLSRVKKGALDLKEVLDSLKLVSFLKTSGGKGYHIVVPLSPKADWDTASAFCKEVAEFMAKKFPKLYTSNIRKSARGGKLFVDWQRNIRGATSVCAYSLRARERASVSMPIAWEELDSFAPDFFTLDLVLERLEGPDPWQGFFDVKQSLKTPKRP